jgi:integrase
MSGRKSVAVLETGSAPVNWHCAEVGESSPFDDRRISLMVRGMKAEFRRPAQPRLPFTISQMRSFMKLGTPDALRTWRVAIILAVCFADLLRFSEVSSVRLEDISVKRAAFLFA